MRGLIALMLLALLGGCWWEGPVFYPPDPTRAGPLTPGVYESVDAEGKAKRVRLLRGADGSYISEPKKPTDPPVTFVPLAFPGRDLWITVIVSIDPNRPGAAYGLLEKRGDDADLLPLLMCDETEAIVKAAGGIFTPQKELEPPTCRFETAAALERGLTAFAKANPRLPKAAALKRMSD